MKLEPLDALNIFYYSGLLLTKLWDVLDFTYVSCSFNCDHSCKEKEKTYFVISMYVRKYVLIVCSKLECYLLSIKKYSNFRSYYGSINNIIEVRNWEVIHCFTKQFLLLILNVIRSNGSENMLPFCLIRRHFSSLLVWVRNLKYLIYILSFFFHFSAIHYFFLSVDINDWALFANQT